VLADCSMNLSGFEHVAAIGSDGAHSSELHWSPSNGIAIIMSRIDRHESEMARVIEQQPSLKRPCIGIPLGLIIRTEGTELSPVATHASQDFPESVPSDGAIW
jgi:hypothetical protein